MRLKSTTIFLSIFCTFLVLSSLLLFLFPKGSIEILINKHHHQYLDFFFFYWTNMGDGILFVLLIIALLFVSYGHALAGTIIAITQTILVQGMKRFVFPDMPRPKAFLTDVDLYFIEGLKIHSYHSFPSGHTATAFSIAFILCYLARNNVFLPSVYFILATLVGFSRVYLLQHFFMDAYFGAIFGVASAIIGYGIWGSLQKKYNAEWMHQRSLKDLWKR